MASIKTFEKGRALGYTDEEWAALPSGTRWRKLHPDYHREHQKKWREKNREYNIARQRQYQLAAKYGITEDDYTAMLEEQKGCCAICKTSVPTGKWKVFAVDHCHSSGEVRGLLCNECNRGMGLLRDDARLLRAAADYLDTTGVANGMQR